MVVREPHRHRALALGRDWCAQTCAAFMTLPTIIALRIRLKLRIWRLLATRALQRTVRRAAGWLEPAG